MDAQAAALMAFVQAVQKLQSQRQLIISPKHSIRNELSILYDTNHFHTIFKKIETIKCIFLYMEIGNMYA